MNLQVPVTDNVTELLLKIVKFTRTRREILTQNILNMHRRDFVPKDLDVYAFCDLLNDAIAGHIQSQRLVLRDTDNIKFGASGSFEASPIIDRYARELLEQNKNKYLELQIHRIGENSLNLRIAKELLRQKESWPLPLGT